jgi:pyruvate dehydrogenase E1 component beta subunit
MPTITYRDALNQALREELQRDDRVFLMGEEVGVYQGAYKVSKGLLQEFGEMRVVDTPITELGFAGVGVGAAMAGLRPIIEFMTWNFALLALDQVVNNAAKILYMSGGQFNIPIVFRGPNGAALQLSAQHSQALDSWLAHIPGLKVVSPGTPYDAKGLLKSAIRDDNPVVFFEDKMMYQLKGGVPEGDYTIPLGVADVKRAGKDVTLVATSSMVQVSLRAAEILDSAGIAAEVIDVRTTVPLDAQTLVASARKTGRAIVIDEGYHSYGVTAEIASLIADGAFYYLDAPVKRMGAMDVPVPFSPVLEDQTVPTPEAVAEIAKQLCGKL